MGTLITLSLAKHVALGLLACVATASTGCTHLESSVDVADVAAKYGGLGPRWSSPVEEIGSLLYVGHVADPATTGGVLVPQSGAVITLPGREWLTAPSLSAIQVYIVPGIGIETEHLFGPRRGSPVGTYEFSVRTDGDADCDEYERVMTRAQKLLSEKGAGFERLVPQGSCLSLRFLGPLELGSAKYHYLSYFDAEFEAAGYGVMVEELRDRSSQTVARNVTCFQNYVVRQLPTCAGNTRLLDIFERD